MKLEDLKDALFAWFPKEAHKKRPLPGGGQHYYLPHQAIADRLNDVAYGYWEESYTEPTTTGKITTVMCKLTICGITRVGIADNKTDPDVNDEGKEKIIGSVVVNTGRAAFKNAAERFGIGVYLNAQKSNSDMQKYLSGWKPSDNTGTQTEALKPKTAAKPQGLYPQNKAIANNVFKYLEVPFTYAKFVLDNQFSGASVDSLSPDQFQIYLERLVIKGKERLYSSEIEIVQLFRKYMQLTGNNPIKALQAWEVDENPDSNTNPDDSPSSQLATNTTIQKVEVKG